MTINSDTDIYLAIEKLNKNNNIFKLSQSIPPHNIISWDSSNSDTQPTDDELNAAFKDWKDQDEYKSKRAAEYPSIADQLDDIYHNGIDAWKATIKTTKDKYPKS